MALLSEPRHERYRGSTAFDPVVAQRSGNRDMADQVWRGNASHPDLRPVVVFGWLGVPATGPSALATMASTTDQFIRRFMLASRSASTAFGNPWLARQRHPGEANVARVRGLLAVAPVVEPDDRLN